MYIDPAMQAKADVCTCFRRLGMAGAVLHLGAHPDDEDAGLIAYMARKHAVRTVYWSATRGEGGQNRIGPYKAEALAIYRTWESLAARAVDGGEALFGPFYDFGFSKSGEEALRKWDRDVVLRELVRAIRFVQPHVVISRWSGNAAAGHGHHQALGALAPEAFEAAADPRRFPELAIQGLAPWCAAKLYASTGGDWQPGEDVVAAFGRPAPEYEAPGYVRINAGELDPLLGRTYQEQGAIALNRHQTQGIGFVADRGDYYYYYRLVTSKVPVAERERTVFDGFDPALTGLADDPIAGGLVDRPTLEQLKRLAGQALALYLRGSLPKAAALLLEGRGDLERLSGQVARAADGAALAAYLSRKVGEFNDLAVRCLGLKLDCLLDRARISPGQTVQVTIRLWSPSDLNLEGVEFAVEVPEGWNVAPEAKALPARPSGGVVMEAHYRATSPASAELSCPYWLRQPRLPYRYCWPDVPPLEYPFAVPLLTARCHIRLGRHEAVVRAPAERREAFPGGYRELPLSVIPPISLRPRNLRVFLPIDAAEQEIEILTAVRSNVDEGGPAEGVLSVDAPSGWRVEPREQSVSLARPSDALSARLAVHVPAAAPAGCYPLRCVIRCDGRDYDTVLEAVRAGEPGLPGPPDATTCVKEELSESLLAKAVPINSEICLALLQQSHKCSKAEFNATYCRAPAAYDYCHECALISGLPEPGEMLYGLAHPDLAR